VTTSQGSGLSEARRRPARAGIIALLAASTLSGCAHTAVSVASPGMPGEDPRCAAAADQPSALISEWSPAEKANLQQALAGGGVVAVEHLGCQLRVLSQCRAPGGYTWQRTGPAQASVEIDGERALFERLPLSAGALQADLRQAGRLRLATQVAGEYRLQAGAGAQLPPQGECQYATHVITALSVGASALMTGDGRMIRSNGDAQACARTPEGGPDPACSAPLQISLSRVPGRGPQEPPPGMAQVDVVSAFEEQTWDVFAGDAHVCTTPCTTWVDPLRPLSLVSQGGRRDEIWVSSMGEALETRNAVLVATGHHRAKYVNGLVFTTLGGMGVVVGITFMAVGCSDLQRRGGACTAGLITGAVSLPITAIFTWLIVDSMPHADVFPVLKAEQGRGLPPITVGMGPGGIAGTF
jgi:hypothetical protein